MVNEPLPASTVLLPRNNEQKHRCHHQSAGKFYHTLRLVDDDDDDAPARKMTERDRHPGNSAHAMAPRVVTKNDNCQLRRYKASNKELELVSTLRNGTVVGFAVFDCNTIGCCVNRDLCKLEAMYHFNAWIAGGQGSSEIVGRYIQCRGAGRVSGSLSWIHHYDGAAYKCQPSGRSSVPTITPVHQIERKYLHSWWTIIRLECIVRQMRIVCRGYKSFGSILRTRSRSYCLLEALWRRTKDGTIMC